MFRYGFFFQLKHSDMKTLPKSLSVRVLGSILGQGSWPITCLAVSHTLLQLMFHVAVRQLLAWPCGRCQRCCQMRLSEASLRFFHHPVQKNMMSDVGPSNIKTCDQSAKALSVELEQIFTLGDVGKLWWWMEHWLRLIDTSNHAPCWDLIFPVSWPDFVDFVTWRTPPGQIWGNRYLFVRLWS